jgi:plasmid stabilization system protein ParE
VTCEVEWSATAREHVLAITEYLARTSPVYAERFVDRVLGRIDQLALFPESGRVVPEARDPSIRELLEGSYRILSFVRPGRIDILAVLHVRQQLAWSSEKPNAG